MSKYISMSAVGIIVYKDMFLFLKRTNPPMNWCPPCGRVVKGESILDGLKREIKEECGLEANIIDLPLETWPGVHNSEKIFSVTYICFAQDDKVILSDEHSDYRWVTIDNLYLMNDKTDFKISKWKGYLSLVKNYIKNHLNQ